MNTPRDWKSERILKVAGSIVREGVFHGHPGEVTSNPHALKPSKFTPEVIEKAFKNISGPIPIFMTHDMKGQPRDQIGNTFHAGITPSKDDIEVKGMIWKDSAINRIKNESLNRFSPEFDFDYDAQGNIMNARITGLIPTNNPAIDNPPIIAVSSVFDSIGGASMPDNPTTQGVLPNGNPSGSPGAQPNVLQTTIQPGIQGEYLAPLAVPAEPAKPASTPATIDPALIQQINAMSQQMAANQQLIQNLIAERDSARLSNVNGLLSEIKTLGVQNPENMIQGLPAEAQLNVLRTIKETLSLRAPVVQGGSSAGANVVQTKVDVENSILKEIGISRKEYDRLMASPCPSLDREE